MNYKKKTLSVLLSVVLAVTLVMPTFASEAGSGQNCGGAAITQELQKADNQEAVRETVSSVCQKAEPVNWDDSGRVDLMTSSAPITIITQPEDQSGAVGDLVSFGIIALGSNLSYKWYMNHPLQPDTWTPIATEDAWTIPVEEQYDGLRFYCLVTDDKGNSVKSDTVTLTVISDESGIVISMQPKSQTKKVGDIAVFGIEASGENLTYTWYVYSPDNPGNVAEASTDQYFGVNAEEDFDGLKIYCIIKSDAGKTRKSNEVTLTVLPYDPDKMADVVGNNLNLAGSIGVNYYMHLSDEVLSDNGAKVVFSLPNDLSSEVMVKDAKVVQVKGAECREFGCKLHSSQMTGEIRARVVLSDGTESEEYPYTVKTYADLIIKNENNNTAFTKVKPLIKAMLNYGGYAQAYFQYDDSPLANKDLTTSEKNAINSVSASSVKSYERKVTGSQTGLKYEGSNLMLTSETSIRHYFTVQSGHTISEYTFKLNGKTLVPVKSGAMYYVEIPNIASGNLDTAYTVTAGGITIKYSALSYVYTQLSKTNLDKNLASVLKALFLYNQEANIYFTK